MERVTLQRKRYGDFETMGALYSANGNKLCYTLEPAWGHNREGSCIPEGLYTVHRDRTGKYQYFRIVDSEKINRFDIELHPGNYVSETKGCILCGESWDFWRKEDEGELEPVVTKSGKTLEYLTKILPEAFELLIERRDYPR